MKINLIRKSKLTFFRRLLIRTLRCTREKSLKSLKRYWNTQFITNKRHIISAMVM